MALITAKKAKQIQRIARLQKQEQFIETYPKIIEDIDIYITDAAKDNKNTETITVSSPITVNDFEVLQTILEDHGYTVELNLDERKITITW